MGYYTVESRNKKVNEFAFSMPMAKEICILKLKKNPRMSLMICYGIYVKYDVHAEYGKVVFHNRDSGRIERINLR